MAGIYRTVAENHKLVNTRIVNKKQSQSRARLREHLFIAWQSSSRVCLPGRARGGPESCGERRGGTTCEPKCGAPGL